MYIISDVINDDDETARLRVTRDSPRARGVCRPFGALIQKLLGYMRREYCHPWSRRRSSGRRANATRSEGTTRRSGGRLEGSWKAARLEDCETGRLGTRQGGPRGVRTVGAKEDLGLFAGQK